MAAELVFAVALVLANGFFVASEFAIVRLRPTQVADRSGSSPCCTWCSACWRRRARRSPAPGRRALALAPPMRGFYMATKPLVDALNGLGNLVLKPFGIPPASEAGHAPQRTWAPSSTWSSATWSSPS